MSFDQASFTVRDAAAQAASRAHPIPPADPMPRPELLKYLYWTRRVCEWPDRWAQPR